MVELMIVVLIIGVLVSIALPSFLGTRERAQDKAAQSSARTALTAGRMNFANEGSYATVTLSELQASETSLGWLAGGVESTEPSEVSATTAGGVLVLASYGKSRNCFFMRDDPPNSTTYGVLEDVASSACYAGNSAAVTFSAGW